MSLRLSKISSKKRPRNTESGIALISVLWVLLLLSGLAASASYIARTQAIVVHRNFDIAKAEAAADAAIVASISRLSDTQANRHPPTNGGARHWEFEGIKVEISISKEAGLLDLNKADKDLVLAFLYSQSIEPDSARAMVDQLKTWQTTNGAMQAVQELRQLPLWANQNLDCWASSFTVYTALPGVMASDAPPPVLDALKLANDRRLGGREWLSSGGVPATAADSSVLGEIFRISAKASGSDNVKIQSTWIGRLTGDQRHPTLTMRWDHSDFESSNICIYVGKFDRFNQSR